MPQYLPSKIQHSLEGTEISLCHQSVFTYVRSNHFITPSLRQVLGYYNRRGINPEAFLNEIKYIASDPDDKHFFNVTDEAALKDIVDALGERIFSLEGLTKEYVT